MEQDNRRIINNIIEILPLVFCFSPQDCTASLCRCSKNTCRLTSSVKITSDPAATSWAELYVADGFNLANRNLAYSALRNVSSK